MKIIETSNLILGKAAERQCHNKACDEAAALGYTIVTLPNGQRGIVGKNALTGEDNPLSITDAWDDVKPTPEGRYYIFQKESVKSLAGGILTKDYAIKEKPSAWAEGYTAQAFGTDFDNTKFEV